MGTWNSLLRTSRKENLSYMIGVSMLSFALSTCGLGTTGSVSFTSYFCCRCSLFNPALLRSCCRDQLACQLSNVCCQQSATSIFKDEFSGVWQRPLLLNARTDVASGFCYGLWHFVLSGAVGGCHFNQLNILSFTKSGSSSTIQTGGWVGGGS